MAALIELEGIVKHYPGITALQGVSLPIEEGTTHALVGENGAGKSTLIKIIGGLEQPDAGVVRLHGEPVRLNPKTAQRQGIAIIHQELMLLPELTVAENMFLGRLPGRINWTELFAQAQSTLKGLGIAHIDARERMGNLSLAQQQLVEIARAVSRDVRLLVLDEPTSTLTIAETRILFEIMRRLQTEGKTLVYVSHRLEEVFDIATHITVLRDGGVVGSWAKGDIEPDQVIRQMVGRSIEDFYARHANVRATEILKVEGATRRGFFYDVSFDVHAGEVLGFAGLVGSGRSELLRSIVGLEPLDSGRVTYLGKPFAARSIAHSQAEGIVYLPENRKDEGIFTRLSVRENLSIMQLRQMGRLGYISPVREQRFTESAVAQYSLRIGGHATSGGHLSGGTQQKVLIARALSSPVRVLVLDEPTRGIDVGTKHDIYRLLDELVARGEGVIVISSELPEVLGLSDRIVVMREGRVRAIVPRAEATEERIMQYAVGQERPTFGEVAL